MVRVRATARQLLVVVLLCTVGASARVARGDTRRATTPHAPPIAIPRMVVVAPGETLFVSSAHAQTPAQTWSGQTIVLLPGTIGSAFSMRHLTAALSAEGAKTVVVDLLGMGRSSRPRTANYSLTQQAERVRIVLDSLGVDRVMVVALGTSATAALHLAATHPARVSGVLSIAGGPVDRQSTRGIGLALTLAPMLDNGLGRSFGRKRFVHAVREQSANAEWCTADVVRAYLEPFDTQLSSAMQTLRAMNAAREPISIRLRLSSVRVPIRLLIGDKQSSNAPTNEQIQLLTQMAPLVTVDTVANAGTMIHEEQPAVIVAAVRAMLEAER